LRTRPTGCGRSQASPTGRPGTAGGNLAGDARAGAQGVQGVGHPDAERAFERAHDLARGIADWPLVFPVLFVLWHAHWFQGHLGRAHEEARQLLDLARPGRSQEQLLAAENAIGSCLIHAGENAAGLEHFDRVRALYDPERDASLSFKYVVNFGVSRGFSAAMARFALGWPDAALEEAREAIAYARTRLPINLGAALNFGAHVPVSRGEPHTACEWAEECLSLAQAQGFEFLSGFAKVNRGWALARLGRADDGIGEIRDGIAVWRRSGTGLWEPRHLLLLAEALVGDGRGDKAVADEALAVACRTGQGHFESPLLVARGDALLTVGGEAAAEAERHYREAVEVARAQAARSWELRAAARLARLWHARGETTATRDLLAPVYGRFTEGLDTQDLREAGALLDALT
jgi:predicted ATPase